MKLFFFPLLLQIWFINSAFSQDDAVFVKAVLVNIKGDTINCFIQQNEIFENQIPYKEIMDGKISYLASVKIKSITTSREYFKSVQLGNRKFLVALVIEGKINLFKHLTRNFGRDKPNAQSAYSEEGSSKPSILYAVEKDQAYFRVKKNNFEELMTVLVSDCPSLVQKIKTKAFVFEDLSSIIAEYNSCK